MQESQYQTGVAGEYIRQWVQETLYPTADAEVIISDSGCKRLYLTDSGCSSLYIRQRMQESLYWTAAARDSILDSGC